MSTRLAAIASIAALAATCPAGAEGDGRLHVTHVGAVAPDIISVTLVAGKIAHGDQIPYKKHKDDRVDRKGHQRWVFRNHRFFGSLVGKDERLIYTADRYVGDKLDARWAGAPASYRLTSPDDPAYAEPVTPTAVHRKTKPTDLGRVGPRHAWQFDSPTESVVYLRLPARLTAGRHYTVALQGKPLPAVLFAYDPASARSEAVHVSHIGFHPGGPAKVAFLSCWMGSGGPLDYRSGLPFRVIETATGNVVFEGKTRLSKAKDDRTEDAYKRNFNGTNVYEMDFSALRSEGEFVVSVDGIGCSYPFPIRGTAWSDAFYVCARGFYHQRSGIELGPPYTSFRRPRTFHPGDGVRVYASTCTLMDSRNGLNYRGADKNNFGNLVAGRTDEIVPNAWGGYMDAGDWDRRIQHLIASRYLLELAELFPDHFAGLSLNIPESGDALPDVVSEALFNLDCYRRMQTADGGIRGGIESAEHPRVGEASWQESLDVFAYAPGVWSSHCYAGVAARAARWLEARKPALAAAYRQSAVRAMEFAEREWPTLGKPKPTDGGVVDTRNMAAAELYRLTGDEPWHRVFLETTAFRDPKADLFKWPKHNQRDAAWVYVRTAHPGVDKQVQGNCRRAILREADARRAWCSKTGFRWTRYEWQPAKWTAFTMPDAVSLCRGHALTGDVKYLRAIVLACQFAAGANPANLCYTTGLGHRSPIHPLHIDSQVTDQPPPAGITVAGPLGHKEGRKEWGQKLADANLYPSFDKWPTVEAYWDVFWYPIMCEFTIQRPMAQVAYVWGYLSAVPRD